LQRDARAHSRQRGSRTLHGPGDKPLAVRLGARQAHHIASRCDVLGGAIDERELSAGHGVDALQELVQRIGRRVIE
jgi:hypothetical protein